MNKYYFKKNTLLRIEHFGVLLFTLDGRRFSISKEFAFGGDPHMLNLAQSVVYGIATALGFGLAMILFAGLREQLELANVPKPFKGMPIALITAGILALSFMGFAGLV